MEKNRDEKISPTAKRSHPKVVNLSTRHLSSTETYILSHGLKFNSSDANYIDLLRNLESILQSSPIAEEVRSDIRRIAASQLRNNYPSHPTTVQQWLPASFHQACPTSPEQTTASYNQRRECRPPLNIESLTIRQKRIRTDCPTPSSLQFFHSS